MNIPKIDLTRVKGLAQVGKTFLVARRPEMLLATSVTATIGAVVLAAKGGYEARGIVEEHESGRRIKSEPPLTTQEKIQLTWLCYMPAMVTTVASVGSTSALHLVHVKDKKAMATAALAAVEEVKREAKSFEKEHSLGYLDEGEKEKILEGRADGEGNAEVMGSDGYVEELYLVRDAITGRDIWSNRQRIEDGVIHLCNAINGSGDVDLDYFYNAVGFATTPTSGNVGWSSVHPEIRWSSDVRDDGRPVSVFTFHPEPERDFSGYR